MLERFLNYFRRDLAVDLGTVNTRICAVGEGLVLNEPSVVAVHTSNGRVLFSGSNRSAGCAVGHLARQMQGRTPDSISVVRPLAEGVITDFELCEAMLRYFFRKSQPAQFHFKPRVLVAVPGCITPVEKRAVFNSVSRAGGGEVYLVSQAKVAAVGAGLPLAEPLANMICDVGGGTTEVAILSLADVVASQSVRTGGDKMDQAIVSYMRRHYNLRMGLPAAERLRIEIGSAYPLAQELTAEVTGLDAVSGLPRKIVMTSEETRQALAEPLDEIIEAIKATLDQCGPELAADLVDQGLVLCGGGSLLRGLDRFITEQTGLPARLASDPLSVVAKGALICMEQFARWRTALESRNDDV